MEIVDIDAQMFNLRLEHGSVTKQKSNQLIEELYGAGLC